jgi:hypothetical protein
MWMVIKWVLLAVWAVLYGLLGFIPQSFIKGGPLEIG